MRGEPIGPNPGVREYKKPGGLTFLTHTRPWHEQSWDLYTVGTKMTFQEAEASAVGLLTRPFLEKTFTAMGESPSLASPIDIRQIQMGLRNVIYLVDAGDASPFVLVMSKGTPRLNSETETDFNNLKHLRKGLEERHLKAFVPQTYAVTQERKVSGFSFEYLPDHLELASRNLAAFDIETLEIIRTHATFAALTDSPKGISYNMNDTVRNEMEARTTPSSPMIANNRIKEEIFIHLVLMYAVTDSVPRHFGINAGDFMFDPDKPDFDLRLITIRGGWKKMDKQAFVQWLYDHEEYTKQSNDPKAPKDSYPLFDRNMPLMERALDRANAILTAANQLQTTSSSPRERRMPDAGRRPYEQ